MRPPIRKSIRLKLITLLSDIKKILLGTPHIFVSNKGNRGDETMESLKGVKRSPKELSAFIL
jgi:hypothetical protein